MRQSRRSRKAGIFLPISALPSQGGIGDFGPEVFAFIDWLVRAGQQYWQILPLTIPDSVGSPYAPPSSAAGNWMLISPTMLRRNKILPKTWRLPKRNARPIHHRREAKTRWLMLHAAYDHFRAHGTAAQQKRFHRFKDQTTWLETFALFSACKEKFRGQPWWEWPKPFRSIHTARLKIDETLDARMEFQKFLQWLFEEQWQTVKQYAHHHSIQIIGDLPFYPPQDSVEVWSRPELFEIGNNNRLKFVAGVPPDVFSTTGQKWGNPVYRWPAHRRDKFAWWQERIQVNLDRYHILRLDHFRGYANTWRIPIHAKDGRQGHWVETPGREILNILCRRWPRRPFLAEDLGLFSPNALHLLEVYRIDGMRVWEFGWTGLANNIHHPDNIERAFYFYTSTHDTNTVMGWWRDDAKWYERKHLRAYLGRVHDLHWQAIANVYASRADVAMIPIQDVLGLGSFGRINKPGRIHGNWSWRLEHRRLTTSLARRLRKLVYAADGT